jgi:DNA repair protein RecO (recombination protein O)
VVRGWDATGYVLHARAYGDSSLLLELLTAELGTLAAVARGGRRSATRARLQPFNRLRLGLQGARELKTLRYCEPQQAHQVALAGDRLLMGLYVNELMVRLIGRHEPQERIYPAYEALLLDLRSAEADPEVALRHFEFTLLSALGYGVSFEHDLGNDAPIEPGGAYRFDPGVGFVAVREPVGAAYTGADILRAWRGDFDDPAVRRLAKQVARSAIDALLSGRPLRSRALFARRAGPAGSP